MKLATKTTKNAKTIKPVKSVRTPKAPQLYAGAAISATHVFEKKMVEFRTVTRDS